MKLSLSFYVLLSAGILTAPQWAKAAPVAESVIPASVDWFVHLDGDQLRASRSGSTLIREIRKALPVNEEGQQQLPIDPVLLLDGIRGLTVFGAMPTVNAQGEQDIQSVDGVLLLQGTSELIQIVRGMVSGFQLEKPDAIVTIDHGKDRILSMAAEGIHGAFVDDTRVAIGKSLPALQEFLDVYHGKGAHIALKKRFPTCELGANSGLFFGVFVEHLKSLGNLPVEARVLKLTQAVSIQLGESGDFLNLLASLVTDSAQTGQQVQDVLQGLLALLLITQNGQPDVAALVQSARVERTDAAVTLRIAYPVARVEEWAVVLAEQIRAGMAEPETAEPPAGEPPPVDATPVTGGDEPAGA